MSTKHIIIYSHGFGVRKDDRGLFTDIAASMSEAEHVMFDYNQADEAANTLTVAPLYAQADKLKRTIAETQAQNPDATIDLICHSQGCVAAALLKPQGIRKVIFIAPPATLSVQRMIKIFGSRPGSNIDTDGVSTLSRRDGSTTIVPKEYWDDIKNIQPIGLYNELAKQTRLTFINARQDEVLGNLDFSKLSSQAKVIELDANHDFTNEARSKLIDAITQELKTHRIVIVNDQDKIIGHKVYGTLDRKDIYRASALWATNSKGDILLAQRQLGKRNDPGKWGPAVSGTVDEGETYDDNIIKETEEEIGLTNITPVKSIKRRYTGEHNYFTQWYKLVVDKRAEDFKVQEEEVEQVKWFTRAELEQELRNNPQDYLKNLDWALQELSGAQN